MCACLRCIIQVPLPESMSVVIPAVCPGTVDAVAVWYDLHLDSSRTISTSPFSPTNWDQSIYPVRNHLSLNEGDLLVVDISFTDTQTVP